MEHDLAAGLAAGDLVQVVVVEDDGEVSPQAGAGLAPDAVLHVLRVVQEALTNAIKHASATRLRVRVDHDESGALFVDVSDNGVGMKSAVDSALYGGRGVENMRERARSLGGELDLTAGDSGTSVRLRMPPAGPIAPRGAEA